MIDAVIATITHSRNATLKLVADLNDEQMVKQPAPGTNHPAWVLGHLLGVDYSFLALITGQPVPAMIDDAWRAKYGMKSSPVADKSAYQSKAWYLEKLSDVRAQIIAKLKTITPEELAKPHPDPARRERFPTIGHAVVFYGTWHEAYHAGQLSTWRRVQGLPSV